ncbi:MAG: chromosomal replication initiator protein DnaA [Patescibacteria group bacterium]
MIYSPEELWGKVCAELAANLSQGVFKTWIFPNVLSDVQEVEDKVICTIESPTSFHISIIEKSFKAAITDCISAIVEKPVELKLKVGDFTLPTTPHKSRKATSIDQQSLELNVPENQTALDEPSSPTVASLFSQASIQQAGEDLVDYKIQQAGLNKNYTFDTFAVSSTNEMAHAAAVAVSQNPGKAYNVLFLYGGVGVGKTHLMQAVGQNILKNNQNFTMIYRTGEEFMNEIVEAIQTKKTIQMKQRYRSVQILLIDDIQFMAGKRAMQEEFFHTFNSVLKSRGQVILTSDRPPHEISPLDDRIQSRLEGGLSIDIQQPSFELRIAIVLIKAKQIQFSIPMDIAQRIASAITSTRKLEGIVKALHSEHVLRHKPITHDLVQEILRQHQVTDQKQEKIYAKPLEIIKTISNQYHIKLMDIKGPKRSKPIANARHIAMYLIKHHLDLPFAEIGRYFGDRDHTSVMHAVKKIEEALPANEELRTQVQAVRTSLSGGVPTEQITAYE